MKLPVRKLVAKGWSFAKGYLADLSVNVESHYDEVAHLTKVRFTFTGSFGVKSTPWFGFAPISVPK